MTHQAFSDPQALAQQVMQAANSLSDQEASQRYQQILAQLPPDQAEELNALALSQVSSGERRVLASGFKQAHHDAERPFSGYDYDDDDEAATPNSLGRLSARAQQQDPALLGGLFGQNSSMGGQIGKAALAALAALLIRRMMSGQGQTQGRGMPMGGADPISSILGGLLGGGAGGMGGLGGQSAPMGGDPLSSILGGLLGGGAGGLGGAGGSYGNQRLPSGSQSSGIDLGSILSGVLGGGAARQHVPQSGGDLGSILGSILGGGSSGGSSGGSGGTSHRKDR